MRADYRKTMAAPIALGAALAALADSATAQTATTSAEIESLKARVAELETQKETAVRSATGVKLTFGGYVKTDFIFDTDQSLGDTFFVDGISTVRGDKGESHFRAHARQTRFNLRTESDTVRGPLTSLFEVDLFGSGGNEVFSNSYGLRVRHAVVEWAGFTVGQTWSNFMPIEAYPDTIDFEGPAGIPFIRQAQIRYTLPVGNNLKLSASLENSEFSGRDENGTFSESTNAGIRAGLDEAPDFTVAALYTDDWGLIKAAGVLRSLGSPTSNDTATGWGLSLAGSFNAWEGGSILASASGGEGIGRYIINGFGQDAFIDDRGRVDAITTWGGTLGVRHEFTPTLSGGIVGGYYKVEDTFAQTDTTDLLTVHTTLVWSPVERLRIGGEVIYGDKETRDGRSADNLRLQGAIQVSF